MSNVTFFESATSSTSIDVSLIGMLEKIKSGEYKDRVVRIRVTSDKPERRRLKAKLPAFTVSGTFSGKTADTLTDHSGFIAMDFDELKASDLDHAREMLYADDYTYAGFVSVGGSGLCIIVPIDPKRHVDAFKALEKYYFSKYGFQVDQATKNVNRLRFVSWDPDMYFNKRAKTFDKYPKKAARSAQPRNMPAGMNSDVDHVIEQIVSQRKDITENYEAWCEIGMALKSKYGAAGLNKFLDVSQFHPEYDEEKATKKYKSFKETGGITISTFFHHANNYGIEISTPGNKRVRRAALYGAKKKKPKDEVIDEVASQEGVSPEDVSAIVDQVYKDPVAVSKAPDDDIISQIEDFIQSEKDIRYNEVTLKYELDGYPMNDRDFNTVYLDCRKVYPKTTKDLIMSAIDSDRTPSYNPIKDYFTAHSKKPVFGLIRRLANTIHAVSNPKNAKDVDYVYYFLRKWMVGAVAMWHKHHSPLMLVLAGTRQNTGKSHWFRYLLPQDLQSYYGEAELTGDKDENLMMCNKALIMNDEMSNKSKRDIAMIKKLCSTKWFNLRKPYGRLNEDFRRIAALAGTSNDLALLSDPSGNRRIVPIEVDSIDHAAYNAIDKRDLWVEAFQAYQNGEVFELTAEDVAFLEGCTEGFKEPSAEEELFHKYFEDGKFDEESLRYHGLTNSEIKAQIEVRSSQKLNARKLGMELKRLGYDQFIVKVSGSTKRVYNVKLRQNSGFVKQESEPLPF